MTTIKFSGLCIAMCAAMAAHADVKPVTVENFVRAESALYFGAVVKEGGFGRLNHRREVARLDQQTVIRLNRDTLYSAIVIDLDAAPAIVEMPDSGDRFMSLQVINEDHHTKAVWYDKGRYHLTREDVGTRYVMIVARTFVNPGDPRDLEQAHTVQDALRVEQSEVGTFEVPDWDPASQKRVRDALLTLASTLPNTNGMFGDEHEVDPVRHVIGAAFGWGGQPESEATYLNVTPPANDGETIYRMTVAEVPVDGFWSISVYNAEGYFEPNELNANTLNNVTAEKNADGTIVVQFGGCQAEAPNCLPITEGWNYMVRLYQPDDSILDGSWSFPVAEPLPEGNL